MNPFFIANLFVSILANNDEDNMRSSDKYEYEYEDIVSDLISDLLKKKDKFHDSLKKK